jgi:2-dehydro-3-deoxyphosphogluconate aldolase/(4S)-4-hydroxy-2-oxoglutarate aldolase
LRFAVPERDPRIAAATDRIIEGAKASRKRYRDLMAAEAEHGLRRPRVSCPAEASGGLPALKALAAPFGEVHFCPTGGIREDSAPPWLTQPWVTCVGDSWRVQQGETDFAAISERARLASGLGDAT